jgi:hypothetical protein
MINLVIPEEYQDLTIFTKVDTFCLKSIKERQILIDSLIEELIKMENFIDILFSYINKIDDVIIESIQN